MDGRPAVGRRPGSVYAGGEVAALKLTGAARYDISFDPVRDLVEPRREPWRTSPWACSVAGGPAPVLALRRGRRLRGHWPWAVTPDGNPGRWFWFTIPLVLVELARQPARRAPPRRHF